MKASLRPLCTYAGWLVDAASVNQQSKCSGSSCMKGIGEIAQLLFVTIAALSWQSSLRAQSVARVGVVVTDLSEAEGHNLGLPDRGVYVVDVRNQTSAARAGIRAKDVIFQFDGDPILGVDDFICRVARKEPGESAQLGILRSLARLNITVSLGMWPLESLRSRHFPTGCGVADAKPRKMSLTTIDSGMQQLASKVSCGWRDNSGADSFDSLRRRLLLT